MVAISAFGGLCVHIMASSRMCFVGARNGHMPSVLSLINVKSFTPVPSLVFLVRYIAKHDSLRSVNFNWITHLRISVHSIAIHAGHKRRPCSDYLQYDRWIVFHYAVSIGCIIFQIQQAGYGSTNKGRQTKFEIPDALLLDNKPFPIFFYFQLPLFVPIIFVVVCALLIVVPCYVAPYEVFMGVIITVAGIPVYYMGVVWQDKPKWFQESISKFIQYEIHKT